MNGPTHAVDLKGLQPGCSRTDPDGTVVSRSEDGLVYTVNGPRSRYTIDMSNWDLTPRPKPKRYRNANTFV